MSKFENNSVESQKVVKLGDLIERAAIHKSFFGVAKEIGYNELSSNYLNCNISSKDLIVSQENSISVITEDCLLVGFIGGKFKVARLSDVTEKDCVSLRNEIFPITLRSNEITEDFLLRSVLSENSKNQAIGYSTGSVISRITFHDFCKIEIVVPSLEEQVKICNEDTRKSLSDADRKILETNDEFRRDMHMKKHAMGQTIFNFNNWWKLLQKARLNGNGVINDNDEVGRSKKVKVSDIYDNLQSSIEKLSLQLNKFDVGYGLQKEEFALTDFVEDYISKNKNSFFEFIYNANEHRATEDLREVDFDDKSMTAKLSGNLILRKNDPIEYVKFSQEALTMIFDDIVGNACAHGFKETIKDSNAVKIEIESNGSDYIMTVSNNGSPLKSNLSAEDIFSYGQTTGDPREHFGIGGYEIKKLMREFGGDVEIISSPEEEFTVAYKLIFKDTNILEL